MRNTIIIEARRFQVTVKDLNGHIINDTICISKQQLQAAQLVGQSSKELIHRLYDRQGFKVLDIGKAMKKTVSIDLDTLWGCDE